MMSLFFLSRISNSLSSALILNEYDGGKKPSDACAPSVAWLPRGVGVASVCDRSLDSSCALGVGEAAAAAAAAVENSGCGDELAPLLAAWTVVDAIATASIATMATAAAASIEDAALRRVGGVMLAEGISGE